MRSAHWKLLIDELCNLRSDEGREAAREIGAMIIADMGADVYERTFKAVNDALGAVPDVGPLVVAMCLGSQAQREEDVRMFMVAMAAHYRASKEAGRGEPA